MLCLSLTGTSSESALSFKSPLLERLASRGHCHSTANRIRIIDLWRLYTTYVVQIYSGAWTPYGATHHHLHTPPKTITSVHILHSYPSRTSLELLLLLGVTSIHLPFDNHPLLRCSTRNSLHLLSTHHTRCMHHGRTPCLRHPTYHQADMTPSQDIHTVLGSTTTTVKSQQRCLRRHRPQSPGPITSQVAHHRL